MERSYKFRIYPNSEQRTLIQKTFGCCRFVYNYYLTKRQEAYRNHKTTIQFYECCKDVPKLKEEHEWLKEVDSKAIQSAIQDLDYAYLNFFRRVRQGKRPGYPQYKSKKNHHQSYKTKNSGTLIRIEGSYIRLPKLGFVKCKISKEVKGRILSVAVSQNPSGKYFVAICCTDVDTDPFPKTGLVCGVDLGIKDLAITSDGLKIPNNKFQLKAEKKLDKLQRQLSRKSKESKRYEKQRIKVARAYEKVANQRRDAMHKATTQLIRNYDVICIEDLNANGMTKNRFLSKSVIDASFGEFRKQLEYKAQWYGKTISVIDRFYPSSQLCSCCGAQNKKLRDLHVRKWTCPECGTSHDRDINAAKNILNEGLRLLKTT